MVTISTFKGYRDNTPSDLSLGEMVEIIRKDESVKNRTEKYRYFLSQGLKKEADHEKANAGTFTVAVRCQGGRKLEHVTEFTGLAFGDFDKLPDDQVPELAKKLRNDPHTVLTFITHSGRGLRIVYRYQAEGWNALDLRQKNRCYLNAFETGMAYYERLLGFPSDQHCKDCTRVSNIVHDPEVFFRPEAEPFVLDLKEALSASRKRPGKPRRVSLVPAVKAAQAELDRQGILFEPGHHNDYVSRMGYLLNAYGVDADEALDWAIGEFAGDYHDDIAAIFGTCFRRTEEHGTVKLPKTEKPDKWASVRQIEEFLSSKVGLRYNTVRKQVEILWLHIPKERQKFLSLTDRDEYSLWRSMQKTGINVRIGDLRNVIHSDFAPEFHPFHAYFQSLPPWDGTDHIGALAHTVHTKGNQQQFVDFFRKWFVSIVPTLFDEQVVNHEILVFIGRQGTYKSTFFQKLLPPELEDYFYSKTNNALLTKDDILTMSEYGLICLDEIDGMRSANLDQLKAMVTVKHTNERAAYARNKERRAHIASFCGTGNNPQFLIDPSGNRRWIAAEVVSIDSPYLHPFNYEGIYSQAYALWKEGSFKYWLEDDEIVELNERNREFEVPDMEEELIQTYYRLPFEGCRSVFLSVSQILERINAYLKQPLSPIRLGLALKRLGFPCKKVKGRNGYLVVERSLEEIKASNTILAKEIEHLFLP